MRVEVLWFAGCPHHVAARAVLERVLASRGIDPAAVQSVEVDPASAETVRFPGSPTIRIDGRDVDPGFREPDSFSLSCRVYPTPLGMRGIPPAPWVEDAIDSALSRETRSRSVNDDHR